MFVVQHDDGVGRYVGSARNSGRGVMLVAGLGARQWWKRRRVTASRWDWDWGVEEPHSFAEP